jgi:hypothetical protein
VEFARSKSCNPYDPEFWYTVYRSDLHKEKVTYLLLVPLYLYLKKRTATVIKLYGGSAAKTLLDLFPNIGLDTTRLFRHKSVYFPLIVSYYSLGKLEIYKEKKTKKSLKVCCSTLSILYLIT